MTTNHSVVPGRELKSCPFCGGKATYWRWHSPVENAHAIGCENEGCPFEPWHPWETYEEALKAWNTRAHTPVTQGRDECREAFETYMLEELRLNWPGFHGSGDYRDYDDKDWKKYWLLWKSSWQAAWQRAQTPREEAGKL